MQEIFNTHKQSIIRFGAIFAVLLSLFLLVHTALALKEYRLISTTQPGSTITVSGFGKVERAPDTAKITFTVMHNAKTVAEAQKVVAEKITQSVAAVVATGITEEYITTNSYNSYPNYDYPEVACMALNCPRPGAPVLRDYTVSQSVSVNIKNLDIVESVIGTLGTSGVTTIDGPNLGFEDDKVVVREARDLAIADAQAEAEKLADALGVKIVRVVSFSENGGGMPMPMYAKAGMADMRNESGVVIPNGVQTVQSNVSVTYEIR